MNKEEMYHTIKQYMYAMELKDLKIFSKQYLSIMQEKYSNNKETEPYSVIAIDFNKMNDINNLHGMKKGDKVIHDIIEIIMRVLPQNAQCIRTGGDEFLIVLTGEHIKNKKYINKIEDEIEKEKERVLGCSITSTILNSKNFNNLAEMMNKADQNILIKKKVAKDKIKKTESLEYFLEGGFNTLFKSLRLHQDYLSKKELKSIYQYFLTAVAEEERNKTITEKEEETEREVTEEERTKSTNIDNMVNKRNPTIEEIEEIENKDYEEYMNRIVREKNTEKMSKAYLYQHLLEEEEREFEALYISMGQIKLSNSKSNYETTNQMIKKIMEELREYIIEEAKKHHKKLNFPNEIFSEETKNMMIDLGGGDFLLLIDPQLPAQIIFEGIRQHIKEGKEIRGKETLLKVVASKESRKINKENVNQAIEEMKETTLEEKDKNIHELLQEEKVMVPIMQSIFREAFISYRNKTENPYSIEDEQKFIRKMAEVGLEKIVEFNDSQKKFINAKEKNRKEEETR